MKTTSRLQNRHGSGAISSPAGKASSNNKDYYTPRSARAQKECTNTHHRSSMQRVFHGNKSCASKRTQVENCCVMHTIATRNHLSCLSLAAWKLQCGAAEITQQTAACRPGAVARLLLSDVCEGGAFTSSRQHVAALRTKRIQAAFGQAAASQETGGSAHTR